ncbi:MAG: RagB/SusD family nutrient uptake outer membrane protein [Muribaculaceae bacterium]|nr:RagB/SusD family nutrient uptake outer membrane protein [Muribaculaceae bacterium]
MKSLKKYILVALAACTLTSCEDTLMEKPSGSYEEATFFDSEEHAEMALYGIMSSISENTHYGWYEQAVPCSDDTYFTSRTTNDNAIHDMAHYVVRNTNTWVARLWLLKYQALDRANRTVAGIESMGKFNSSDKLRQLACKARFLRAFMAFDLVKSWGDVPFAIQAVGAYDQAFRPRVSRELIYDQILEDLEIAGSDPMPWASAGVSSEEITAGAAHALAMRVLMQRAGYSLQLNGEMARPDDARREEYFKEVIRHWEAIRNNGYHDFNDGGYADFFKSLSHSSNTSQESIWEVGCFHEQGRRNGSTWGIYNGPLVAAPTGIPVTEQSAYMGRTNAFFYVVPEWYDFYEESDVRRDVNICTYRYTWNASKREHTKDERGSKSWYVGKWRREWMDPSVWNKNMNYGDINVVILRYSDMVLHAAEAYNELKQPDKAWELISQVRTRANASPVDASTFATVYAKARQSRNPEFIPDGSEQGKIRQALYFERAFEMCYEGVRKFDLIRWGCLYDALKLFGENSVVNSGTNLAYPAYRNFIPGHSELLPIPLVEIQSNSALNGVNNPGY